MANNCINTNVSVVNFSAKKLEPTYYDGFVDCLDHTFGVDDFIIAKYERQSEDITPIEDVNSLAIEQLLNSPIAIPISTTDDVYSLLKEGDQVFKYQGVLTRDHFVADSLSPFLIVRRSIFTDPCDKNDIQWTNVFRLTRDEVKAVAYFSDTPYDKDWCDTNPAGLEKETLRPIQGPWNLADNTQLVYLKTAIDKIDAAQKDPSRDPLQLASSFTPTRLFEVKKAIALKVEENKTTAERLLTEPAWQLAWEAKGAISMFLLGGFGTGLMFHWASKTDSPLSKLWEGAKALFRKDPPDDPPPSAPSNPLAEALKFKGNKPNGSANRIVTPEIDWTTVGLAVGATALLVGGAFLAAPFLPEIAVAVRGFSLFRGVAQGLSMFI